MQKSVFECQVNLAVDGPQAAGLADHALKMRALETGVRARADFVTCVTPAVEEYFRSTEGTAPSALVPLSIRHVRFTERRYEQRCGIAFVADWLAGSDSPNGESLTWVEAMGRAQLARSDASRVLPDRRADLTNN